jgi:hypothetical protein
LTGTIRGHTPLLPTPEIDRPQIPDLRLIGLRANKGDHPSVGRPARNRGKPFTADAAHVMSVTVRDIDTPKAVAIRVECHLPTIR